MRNTLITYFISEDVVTAARGQKDRQALDNLPRRRDREMGRKMPTHITAKTDLPHLLTSLRPEERSRPVAKDAEPEACGDHLG